MWEVELVGLSTSSRVSFSAKTRASMNTHSFAGYPLSAISSPINRSHTIDTLPNRFSGTMD